MERRDFFKAAGTLGLSLGTPAAFARQVREADGGLLDDIDPYYLDSGVMSEQEYEAVAGHIAYEDRDVSGAQVMRPRGRRPDRAPTYRFLYWQGGLNDAAPGFSGPLSLEPAVTTPPPYRVNAQILGFNTNTRDWKRDGDGTLTVEFRARNQDDAVTWMHLQSFNVVDGYNNIGREFVAHRDGNVEDVVAESPNVDMRIQLIRHARPPGALRKIIGVASAIIGTPAAPPGPPGPPGMMARGPAMLRVPRMAQEAVAFAQAAIGGSADEAPIWRSGFTTYGVAQGGSRLTLRPGLWVAMDKIEGVNAKDLRLTEGEGSIKMLHNGEEAEFSYLVLDMRIQSA